MLHVAPDKISEELDISDEHHVAILNQQGSFVLFLCVKGVELQVLGYKNVESLFCAPGRKTTEIPLISVSDPSIDLFPL